MRGVCRQLALAALVLVGCADDGLKKLGDLCATDDECASGRCDEFLCKAANPAEIGQRCNHALQCRSARCVAGVCAAGVRGPGTACTDGQQCLSGHCSAGVCGELERDGGPAADGGVPADARVDAEPDVPSWCKRIGGPYTDGILDLALDSAGNVYAIGEFADTVDFGGERLTSVGDSWEDVFVASYRPGGGLRWTRQYWSSGWDRAYRVVPDHSGNIYFAASRATVSRTHDLLLGSLRGDTGAERWTRRIPWEPGVGWSWVGHLGVGASGALTIGGAFYGQIDFGGGLFQAANTGGDLFVASLSSTDGAHLWSYAFITGATSSLGGAPEAVHGAAEDRGGNLYVVGEFAASGVDLGGGVLTSAGGADIFLGSFTAAGAHRWSRRFGATDDDAGLRLALGGDGKIYVVSVLYGPADLGGGMLPHGGLQDVGLACYTANGEHLWSKQFGGAGVDWVSALVLDADDNIFITGEHGDSIDFGGDALPSTGGADAFVAGFTAAGAHRWSRSLGGTGGDFPTGLAVNDQGAVYLAGYFAESGDFGCEVPLTSAGQRDGFLVKLVQP